MIPPILLPLRPEVEAGRGGPGGGGVVMARMFFERAEGPLKATFSTGK